MFFKKLTPVSCFKPMIEHQLCQWKPHWLDQGLLDLSKVSLFSCVWLQLGLTWLKWVTNSSFAILDLSAGRGRLGLARCCPAAVCSTPHTTTYSGAFAGERSYPQTEVGIHPSIHKWGKEGYLRNIFEEHNSLFYVKDLRNVMASNCSSYDDLYGDIFLLSWGHFWTSASKLQCSRSGLSCEENKASGTLVNNAHCAAKFNSESNQLIKWIFLRRGDHDEDEQKSQSVWGEHHQVRETLQLDQPGGI